MGVFLCPDNLSWLLFIVPCNQQGNQVPIYNKSFGDFIGTNWQTRVKYAIMLHKQYVVKWNEILKVQ